MSAPATVLAPTPATVPAPVPEPPSASELGPLVYRCAVPEVFVKRSLKPTATRIIRVKKAVGQHIHSTGAVWIGAMGAKWAELDGESGEAGWILVSGPGFGLSGPALVDANDKDMMVVEVFLLGGMEKGGEMQGVIWERAMGKDTTVGQVKADMARDLDLRESCCVLSKDKPSINGVPGSAGQRLPIDFMVELRDTRALGKCGFEGDRAILLLVYVGDMPESIEVCRKPLPKLRDVQEARLLGVL